MWGRVPRQCSRARFSRSIGAERASSAVDSQGDARSGRAGRHRETVGRVSGCAPFVAVMETADLRDGNGPAGFRCRHGPQLHTPVQRGFVADAHIVQTLAAEGAEQAFDVPSLPNRSRDRKDFLDANIPGLLREVIAKRAIPIAQKVAPGGFPRKRFTELLSGSLRRRMSRDAKTPNSPLLVGEVQTDVSDLEAEGRRHEELHRDQALHMVLQKGPPGLRRRLAAAMPSLRSSPWMRAAPPSGFSRLIMRNRSRMSFRTAGRLGCPRRTFQVQNSRKTLRCQAMTVSGLTMSKAVRQSPQIWHSHAQRSRSADVTFGRFAGR